jgi:hypothetical protein
VITGRADEPVAEVAEARTRRERPTGLAVESRLHRRTFADLTFTFFSARHGSHAGSLESYSEVENRPQGMGPNALKMGRTAENSSR